MEHNWEPRNKPPQSMVNKQLIREPISHNEKKDSLFNEWCCENEIATNKQKIDPYLTPLTKINSKWINNLKCRSWNYRTLKEIRKMASWPWSQWQFLRYTIKSTSNRGKNRWDYIILKSFTTTSETISKVKRQHTEWETIFANHISSMG